MLGDIPRKQYPVTCDTTTRGVGRYYSLSLMSAPANGRDMRGLADETRERLGYAAVGHGHE